MKLIKIIEVARGEKEADLLLKNGKLINVFSGEIYETDVAIYKGIIVGLGEGYQAKNIIDINGKYLDNLKLYVDTSLVEPKIDFGSTSKQIVIGTTLIKRGLYAYFDWIFGQNMWFSGGPGIGLSHPEDQNWNSRLNINLGYYF